MVLVWSVADFGTGGLRDVVGVIVPLRARGWRSCGVGTAPRGRRCAAAPGRSSGGLGRSARHLQEPPSRSVPGPGSPVRGPNGTRYGLGMQLVERDGHGHVRSFRDGDSGGRPCARDRPATDRLAAISLASGDGCRAGPRRGRGPERDPGQQPGLGLLLPRPRRIAGGWSAASPSLPRGAPERGGSHATLRHPGSLLLTAAPIQAGGIGGLGSLEICRWFGRTLRRALNLVRRCLLRRGSNWATWRPLKSVPATPPRGVRSVVT